MEEEERQERIKKKREEKRIQAEVKNIILQKSPYEEFFKKNQALSKFKKFVSRRTVIF